MITFRKDASLKETFGHETDFTNAIVQPDNIASLRNALNLEIAAPTKKATEIRLGAKRADAVLETTTGATIVIEVQFGQSDYKHLGQLITYDAHLKPDYAVWVAEGFDNDILNAIDHLNNDLGKQIYPVRVIARGNTPNGRADDVIFVPLRSPDSVDGEDTTSEQRSAYWKLIREHAHEMSPVPGLTDTSIGSNTSQKRCDIPTQISAATYSIHANQRATRIEFSIKTGDSDQNDKIIRNLKTYLDANHPDWAAGLPDEPTWSLGDNERRTFSAVTCSVPGGFLENSTEGAHNTATALKALRAAIDPYMGNIEGQLP